MTKGMKLVSKKEKNKKESAKRKKKRVLDHIFKSDIEG